MKNCCGPWSKNRLGKVGGLDSNFCLVFFRWSLFATGACKERKEEAAEEQRQEWRQVREEAVVSNLDMFWKVHSWESKGAPPMSHPQRNKTLLSLLRDTGGSP